VGVNAAQSTGDVVELCRGPPTSHLARIASPIAAPRLAR
jgi:hypothetical protein